LYAASHTSSIDIPFTFATTHATCPIEHGSFLPLTAFPSTNFSGLTVAGPYRAERSLGREARCLWEA
jgi:hypothetical protein